MRGEIQNYIGLKGTSPLQSKKIYKEIWSAGKELNLLNTDLQSVASTGLPPAEINFEYYTNFEANILPYLATGV